MAMVCQKGQISWAEAVTVHFIKLLVLAVCIGSCLLTAWLMYPESIEQAHAYFAGDPNHATEFDLSLFFESISTGFTVGFFVLTWFFGGIGDKKRVREIEADKWEIKTVFLLLTGVSYLIGGRTLYVSRPIEALIHWTISVACLVIMLWGYVRKHRAKD